MLNSEQIHAELNKLDYGLEPVKNNPSYAYEHFLGSGKYLYVKRKANGSVDKAPLVLHPDCLALRQSIEGIEGLAVIWEKTKSTSYRRYPKDNGTSQYGYGANVSTGKALSDLITVLTGSHPIPKVTSADAFQAVSDHKDLPMHPLNQILYGPPGTGKTYATTELAVSIAEPEWFQQEYATLTVSERRKCLKEKYDELVNNGRVAFTTFHQSFSYEDFIEGIRADNDSANNALTYKLEDGIFKKIADRAEKAVAVHKGLGLAETPNIWKISIGRRQDGEMRQRYLETGEARVGWNWTGDLKVDFDDRTEKQLNYWDSLSNRNHAVLNNFTQDMKVGDVLLCLKDAETVQAVGIITSDYFFDPLAADTDEHDYAHARKVNWLLKHISLNILPINNQRRMVQQTTYQLGRISWNTLIAELHKQGYKLPSETGNNVEPEPAPNYLLIIDEINRGNISRIFGELITLLEPDKRKGGADTRSVLLPYSKEPFTVPDNLYVIGTMNTADKSLAQLDLALRRRFSFVEMQPKPELLKGVTAFGVDLVQMLTKINQRIEVLLDADHLIGHSYFMPLLDIEDESERQLALAALFKDKLVPLLQEYFFDDHQRIGWVLNDSVKDSKARFIVTSNNKQKDFPELETLFPVDVAGQLLDRRYRLNETAFSQAEAYRGIVA